MKRTAITLADGRELIYFDDDPGAPPRDVPDTRVLPPHSPVTDVRYDVLVDEWVVVSTRRDEDRDSGTGDGCQLCPSAPGRPTEVPAPDYDVVVFEERFPAFWDKAPRVPASDPAADAALRQQRGAGRCEIVSFTSDHRASFADLPVGRVRTVLEAWIDRTRALSALPDVEQVFPFENRGQTAGAAFGHPHGQIYAYPFVTPRTGQMLESARRYRQRTRRDLFSDVVAAEERLGERVISRTEHWIAFVPSAARWPVEIHAYPRRAVRDLPALEEPAREDFCAFYLDLLRRLDALYGAATPYVAGWHQAPVHAGDDCRSLHLEVHSIRRSETKVKYLAGSEASMGAFINDVAPESMAELLRAGAPAPVRFGRAPHGA